jgi:hypothetical protein
MRLTVAALVVRKIAPLPLRAKLTNTMKGAFALRRQFQRQ